MATNYAYIRVSSKKQNEARQVDIMKKYNIDEDNILREKESGRSFDRKVYKSLKNKLKEGDSLYIESVDRLGRKYKDILEEWRILTDLKKVKIVNIGQPQLNTTGDETSLAEQFMKDVLLLAFAYNADQEYLNIKNRQAQGIAVAKKAGKKLGRPKKRISKKTINVVKEWRTGQISSIEAMEKLNIKKSAFYNYVKKVEQGETNEFRRK